MTTTINEIDKFKIIIPAKEILIANPILGNSFLGCHIKTFEDKTIIETSGKIFSTPTSLGEITTNNINMLNKKLYEMGVCINENYLLNDAVVGVVHVKKDIIVDSNPNYYLSELREQFKSNTEKYDVHRFGSLNYTNGLVLIPKAKSIKHRIVFYIKYNEISQNKHTDLGYFNNFDFEYLENLKKTIRIEFQYNAFADIRNAFNLEFGEIPTINRILESQTDVVKTQFNKLLVA